eukprot:GFYU01008568.1.p1 GENE.GFYU01008568.1~~GFYU01008568.1.p1  ORF type:complete len:646 (-),score=131.86 GFYU01008568.1:48-1985(-)
MTDSAVVAFQACQTGDKAQLERFFDNDENCLMFEALEDDFECNPLHYACRYGHSYIVDLVLEYDLCGPLYVRNSEGLTPLEEAVVNGRTSVCRIILQHFTESGEVATLWEDRNESTRYSLLHLATMNDHQRVTEVILWLLQETPGVSLNDTDSQGKTALHHAATNASRGVLKALTDALLTESLPQLDVRDHMGLTPLHCAVVADNHAATKVLTLVGADVALTVKEDNVKALTSHMDAGTQSDDGGDDITVTQHDTATTPSPSTSQRPTSTRGSDVGGDVGDGVGSSGRDNEDTGLDVFQLCELMDRSRCKQIILHQWKRLNSRDDGDGRLDDSDSESDVTDEELLKADLDESMERSGVHDILIPTNTDGSSASLGARGVAGGSRGVGASTITKRNPTKSFRVNTGVEDDDMLDVGGGDDTGGDSGSTLKISQAAAAYKPVPSGDGSPQMKPGGGPSPSPGAGAPLRSQDEEAPTSDNRSILEPDELTNSISFGQTVRFVIVVDVLFIGFCYLCQVMERYGLAGAVGHWHDVVADMILSLYCYVEEMTASVASEMCEAVHESRVAASIIGPHNKEPEAIISDHLSGWAVVATVMVLGWQIGRHDTTQFPVSTGRRTIYQRPQNPSRFTSTNQLPDYRDLPQSFHRD